MWSADSDLVGLQELKRGDLKLVQGDATRLVLRDYVSGEPHERSRVVANLPYNITTAVLKLLLPLGDALDEVFVMLQVTSLLDFCAPSQDRTITSKH